MKEIVNDGFAKVVKPYIDAQDKKIREIIAPVEVSPAEAPHSVGDQIIYNGLLYDVIAPIAVEDPLATSGAGANISDADNIEAQIKATKSQIQAAAAQAAAQNKKTQKMLAPVEEDETDASRAYVIGEQLILDGILYNVIDPIAQHGIITAEGAGANIEEADNVTDQLSSLGQTLTNELANKADSSKAYQTDDAAITEVASNDLLPIYDTSATAKKKIAVSNFIGGLVSNPNLLDNPWFTVNQRGYTSASNPGAGTHFADRWAVRYNPSSGAVAVNDGIVTLTSTGGLLIVGERFEKSVGFSGKTLTASIMLSDGTILSGTEVFPNENSADKNVIDTADLTVYFQYSSASGGYPFLGITCKANKTISIKAVKLELGSVSTLAMDTAPNYAEELLKCQRYYFAPSSCNPVGSTVSATEAYVSYITPTTMRDTPTISAIYGQLIHDGIYPIITGASVTAVRRNCIYVHLEGADFHPGHVCVLQNSSLAFSADL